MTLAALALVFACVQGDAAVPGVAELVAEAEKLGVRTGVVVRTGKDCLFEHRSHEPFVPASNMKLCTAALALARLSPDYRFKTRFYLHEGDDGPVLRVVSGGDPCLVAERPDALPIFGGLTDALRQRGVARIAGIYLDARAWPGPDRPAGWPQDQLGRDYAAPTGAFVLEEGCLVVHLEPGGRRRGRCPVRLEPEGVKVAIRGDVQLTAVRRRGDQPSVWLAPDGLRLGGKLWTGHVDASYRLAVPDPALVYRQALLAELDRNEVSVGAAMLDTVPAGEGLLVHTLESPIEWSIRRMLESSVNFHAEQLLRVVAYEDLGEGSLDAGARRLAEDLRRRGGKDGEWYVADGSGLSRDNRLSPALLGAVLAEAMAADWAASFLQALPRSGVTGTLKDRMPELAGLVRAKTGWIRGASALSGFVHTKSGRRVIFSVLMNYDPKRGGLNAKLKALQDRIVAAVHAAL